MESCQRGLMSWSRKPVMEFSIQGFESLTFRHKILKRRKMMFCKKCNSKNVETRVIFVSSFSSNKFINKIINIMRKLVPRKLKKKNFKRLMICKNCGNFT